MSLMVAINTLAGDKRLKMKFIPARHTVADVKRAYIDEHENGRSAATITLRMRGKELKPDTATLVAVGVRSNQRAVMFSISSKVRGGAMAAPVANIFKHARKRAFDANDPEIVVSSKIDVVLLFKPDEPCAQMPCGHAFCSESMFGTLKNMVTSSDYEYAVRCPQCKAELDFDLCARVAGLNDDEYLYFLRVIEQRSSPETKPCPTCRVECERPESLSKFRVNCIACSGGDWCFKCGLKWRAGGQTVCGNSSCVLYAINEDLALCPMKEASGKVPIPSLRSCPNCLAFIDHSDACKHMKCNRCSHNFCFSCLKPKLSSGWQCGSSGSQCPVAPRQKF